MYIPVARDKRITLIKVCMPSSPNPKPINMAIGATRVKTVNPIKTWRVVKFALVKADPRAKLMVELLMRSEIAF